MGPFSGPVGLLGGDFSPWFWGSVSPWAFVPEDFEGVAGPVFPRVSCPFSGYCLGPLLARHLLLFAVLFLSLSLPSLGWWLVVCVWRGLSPSLVFVRSSLVFCCQ